MKKVERTQTKNCNSKSWIHSIVGILSFLALWEAIVRILDFPIWIIPTPSVITLRMISSWKLLLSNTLVTATEASIGFVIAIVVAILISLLLYSFSTLRSVLYPLLIGSQTVPIITVAPLFVLWFGYGLLPKIVVVVLMSFFPVCISFLTGLLRTDPGKIELMKTMSASKWQILKHCAIPSALPSFFSGLRIAAAYCITAAVIGEWLGAKAGLGELMRRSMHSYSVDLTFASIIIVTLLSILLLWFIQWMERIIIYWKEGF